MNTSLMFQHRPEQQVFVANAADPFKADDPYMQLMTNSEKEEILDLISEIRYESAQSRRHAGIAHFKNHISQVYNFIHKGDERDAIKGFVCGILFCGSYLMVNIGRLKHLICRSKSCTNGCFQKLGYNVIRPTREIESLLKGFLPKIDEIMYGSRQWCIRLRVDNGLSLGINKIIAHKRQNKTNDLPENWANPMHIDSLLNHKPDFFGNTPCSEFFAPEVEA